MIWAVFCLLFGLAIGVSANDANETPTVTPADDVPADVVPVGDSNPCPELPQGAVPLENWSILLELVGQSRPEPLSSSYDTEEDSAFPAAVLYNRMIIGSEDEFRELSAGLLTEIDWETSRVLVIEEYASYKFDTLDRDARLSGIYVFEESLIVSQTSTYYGPCQGVAQDSVGVSFENSFLLIVLPREPATITYHWCRVGDCPPDIP